MFQVIDRAPSTGDKFARAFANLGRATQLIPEQIMQQRRTEKQNAFLKQLGLEGLSDPELQKAALTQKLKTSGQKEVLQDQMSMLSGLGVGQPSGMQQGQEDMDQTQGSTQSRSQTNSSQISDEQIAKYALVNPQVARILQSQKEVAQRDKTNKEERYYKTNEPKLMELADQERKLGIENARYTRLGELFSDPSKFPSGITAALFSKEGQLNDFAYSHLSPEAQEAVKLIIDSTTNIKDSYGARITNFELGTYLKKLPSLLNSPEGKDRVLRDLEKMNEINRLYISGVQDVFDRAGGSDQISFSEAEKKFKARYGSQMDKLVSEFASPKESKFISMPDAGKYMGQKIENEETGEIFISDGTQWKPFKR
jgi:hypothetical protein